MDLKQAKKLLARYRRGQCTEEERRIVESWLAGLENGGWKWTEAEKASFRTEVKARIEREMGRGGTKGRLVNPLLLRVATAAAVIGLIFLAVYGLFPGEATEKPLWVADAGPESAGEVLPGRSGAILTMANGQQVLLDSAGSGTLAMEGGMRIIHDKGEIRYSGTGSEIKEALYNTISTPRGREYQLILSDGTRVWLNAESSIRYPVKFADDQREVEMRGEVYFEVAAQSGKEGDKKPFLVKISDEASDWGMVRVLGTVFNINAYRDQGTVKTTLIEGSVLVSTSATSERLQPGQQSQVNQNNLITVLNGVNTNAVISWKNGFFSYDNTSIETVMKELSRWYDIEVVYEGGIPPPRFFWGDIQRSASLSSVLKILESSGIKFSEEGRKITVLKI